MDEQLDRMIDDGVCQHLSADDVRLKKQGVIVNRPGHMGLRSKMDDDIAFRDQGIDNVRVGDVAVIKLEVTVLLDAALNAVQVAGVGQGVQQKDVVFGIIPVQVVDEIATNEPRAASHQNIFFRVAHDRLERNEKLTVSTVPS